MELAMGCAYIRTMQMQTLLFSAVLLAVAPGCKSKQRAAEAQAAAQAQQTALDNSPTAQAPQQQQEQAQPAVGDSVYFMIERTACYGPCPTYKLTVFQSGAALYEGRRFADRDGRYTGQVDPATMRALKDAAEASGFFRMQDEYDMPVTDLPSLIIRLNTGDRDKKVVGRVGTPQAFKDLGQQVEELLSGVEWTKVGELD